MAESTAPGAGAGAPDACWSSGSAGGRGARSAQGGH